MLSPPPQEEDTFFHDLDAMPFDENISPLRGCGGGKLLVDAAPHLDQGSLEDLSPPKIPLLSGSGDASGLLLGGLGSSGLLGGRLGGDKIHGGKGGTENFVRPAREQARPAYAHAR